MFNSFDEIKKESVNSLLYNTSAVIDCKDFGALASYLADNGKFVLSVEWVDSNGQRMQVRWVKKESYEMADYVANYEDTAADIVADWCRDNNVILNDDDDICEQLEKNGGDYYDLVDSALPEFMYNYEIVRFFAENWGDFDDIEIKGGNLDGLRWAAAQAIQENADNENILKLAIEKLNQTNEN